MNHIENDTCEAIDGGVRPMCWDHDGLNPFGPHPSCGDTGPFIF